MERHVASARRSPPCAQYSFGPRSAISPPLARPIPIVEPSELCGAAHPLGDEYPYEKECPSYIPGDAHDGLNAVSGRVNLHGCCRITAIKQLSAPRSTQFLR
jgi:hypothetical protein